MSTFALHFAAVKSGKVEKANVTGIRKALNTYARISHGYGAGRTAPRWSFDELDAITAAIYQHKPKISGELHDTGFAVIRSPRWSKRFAGHDLAAVDHFRLARFDDLDPRGFQVIPVYHACDKRGVVLFTFRNVPWQTAFTFGLESGPTIEGN